MKKGIAFFDFDGTITRQDSLWAFLRFACGPLRLAAGLLRSLPFLVLYKLGRMDNQCAKEKLLARFFAGMPAERFHSLCRRFAQERLPALVRAGAAKEMVRLREKGFILVVVSASPEDWLRDWAKDLQVELIASRLELKEGRLTGRLEGKNCHGEEKVRRILEKYRLADYGDIYAYGDTAGDRPMLALATRAFFRPFRKTENITHEYNKNHPEH